MSRLTNFTSFEMIISVKEAFQSHKTQFSSWKVTNRFSSLNFTTQEVLKTLISGKNPSEDKCVIFLKSSGTYQTSSRSVNCDLTDELLIWKSHDESTLFPTGLWLYFRGSGVCTTNALSCRRYHLLSSSMCCEQSPFLHISCLAAVLHVYFHVVTSLCEHFSSSRCVCQTCPL